MLLRHVDYGQAIKCYLNALRIDPENVQILRDLSLLQMQMRDTPGYEETRRKILVMQSAQRINWISYSVGAYLNGHVQSALSILDTYQSTLTLERSIEHSEMLMYKLRLVRQTGDLQKSLELIDQIRPYVLDEFELSLNEADLYRSIGDMEPAERIYKDLIEKNPDYQACHDGLVECLRSRQCSDDDVEQTYARLSSSHPQSNLCKIVPLDVITDDGIFQRIAADYIATGVRKGIPSLFRSLRRLYADPAKRQALSDIIQAAQADESSVWALALLAQHYDFVGEPRRGLDALESAIEHASASDRIDLLILKARLLKHCGALAKAHETMESARVNDLQDRFLNTKTVRYAFRCGLIDEAARVVALFLRDGDTLISLTDMQCMWYELALAEALVASKEIGPALKKFTSVSSSFSLSEDSRF